MLLRSWPNRLRSVRAAHAAGCSVRGDCADIGASEVRRLCKDGRRDAEKLARCYRAGELTAVWVPETAHEALRDLVRAREAAKKDQLRDRHRLGKFLLRHGKRPTDSGAAWTKKYVDWIRVHARFDEPALEATLAHDLHEVDHAAERIGKLDQAIDEAVKQAAPEVRAVIEALQALRGVAETAAATVVCELGSLSRFESLRQLMGLQRTGPPGKFQRRQSAARRDHQDGQRTSAKSACRVGLVLPTIGRALRVVYCGGRRRSTLMTRSNGSHGRRNSDCTNASPLWQRVAKPGGRS